MESQHILPFKRREWPVRISRGLLRDRATLRISHESVVILPRQAGAALRQASLSALWGASAQGERLVIRTEHGVWSCRATRACDIVTALSDALLAGLGGPPDLERIAESSLRGGPIPVPPDSLVEPAVRWISPEHWSVGAVLLTPGRLRFLPISGAQDEAFDHAQAGLLRGWVEAEEPGPHVCVTHANTRLRLCLLNGTEATQRFWQRCRIPSRVIPFDRLGPTAIQRISGRAPFVRLSVDGVLRAEHRPGLAARHPDGVALVMKGPPNSLARRGDPVRVAIGQPEGIYEFDTRVALAQPIGDDSPGPGGESHLLILEPPDHIAIFNLRHSFRAPLDQAVQVRIVSATGSARPLSFSATLRDLSVGGCALAMHLPLDWGARLDLTAELAEGSVTAQGCVVRSSVAEDGLLVHAIEFSSLDPSQEDIIHRAVLARQRLALARSGPGDAPI